MMKTSFTHYLRGKWIHYIPIIAFALLLNIKSYGACDASWSEVTMTINCEGDFNFTVDNKDFKSVLFAGYVGGSQTSFWPLPAIHAASTYAPGSKFVLEVTCNDDSKDVLIGNLPNYNIMGGMGAGTYSFTSTTDTTGMMVDEYDASTNNFNLGLQFVSKQNPTCAIAPNNMDGTISIRVTGTNLSKCDSSLFRIYINGGSPRLAYLNDLVTFTGLGEGSYSFTASVDKHSCPCDLGNIAPVGPIVIVGPTSGTTSIACNAQVNVSVSQACVATINATDMLRGVTDPCDPMLAMLDSIAVLAGGVFLGGSGSGGFGVTIPDVRDIDGNGTNILGEPLKVEVYSKDGNYCWGNIILEDKSAPIVTCNDPSLMEISCLDFDGSINEVSDIIASIIEPGECSDFEVITLADPIPLDVCDDANTRELLRRIVVSYRAIDEFGNASEACFDTLDVVRFDTIPGNDTLDVPGCILMPPNFNLTPVDTTSTTMIQGNLIKLPVDSLPLTCTGDYVHLDPDDPFNPAPAPIDVEDGGSGFPRLFFTNSDGNPDTTLLFPLNYRNATNAQKRIIDDNLANCSIAVDFEDLVFDFGCKQKILRQWFLREWYCDIEQILPLGQQEIIITDFEAPVFDEVVPDIVDRVDAHQCSRFINIPKPLISDNCDIDDLELELAIYRVDEDDNWNLIGPTVLNNGMQNMSFDFPQGMSFIVYTAFDDCGNAASDTTKVTIEDNTPPTTICKEFLVIGISGDGNVTLPATSIDNGSTDQCELERICVTRMDDIELLESLGSGIDFEVLFSTFDNACQARADAGDGCYRDFSSSSYERNGKFYINRHTLCTPYIEFCCDDIDNQGDEGIMVELRAYDVQGNVNPCMTFVELQDKNPAVITCMPNITIDCNFDLPAYNNAYDNIADDPLSQYFGSIVEQGQQKFFGIPDEFILSTNTIDYVDGTIFDNCNIPRISVEILTSIDNCGIGFIRRRAYSHEDPNNRRLVCTQFISIRGDAELEVEALFSSLRDTTLVGCMTPEEIVNESFGAPNLDSVRVKCSLLGVSTENQLFLFNTQDQQSDACFKVVRTFTVIDWCKSTAGNPYTVGTFRQVIKVNDPDGPTITCSDDVIQEITDCAGGEVMLMATASDECTEGKDQTWTGRVELDRNGDGIFETFDDDIIIIVNPTGNNTSKATHTAFYPLGTHRITWTVTDRCGNFNSCVQNFTIINTKKPTPFAVDISTVLMNTNGMVEVWAADLENKPNQGPCGQTLMSSIVRVSDIGNRTDGGFGISEAALTFTCADVGDAGIDVNYFVYYVAGTDSIFDFTTVNIRIQDNNDVCNNATSAFISGNIHTEDKSSLPNVSVGLVATGNQVATAIPAAMTNVRGDYAFPAMPQGGSYTLDPSNDDDYLNGVTTLDLVMIQRYVLGLMELESPYRILAADINNDLTVSAIDLVELRSVILGYKESFSNNESWRFIDESFVFDDPTYPFEKNLGEFYNIDGLSSNMSIDFVGLKVGDVNGSVEGASLLAENRSTYNLTAVDQTFEKGKEVNVVFKASEFIKTVGLQMTVAFDKEILDFIGFDADRLEIGSEHLGTHSLDQGELRISWSDYLANTVEDGSDLFTLRFEAKESGRLSDIISLDHTLTSAEIYNDDLESSNLGLLFKEITIGSEFALYQNIPNPFAENTLISFYLPKSSDVTLSISDVTGRVIKNYTGSFDKGNNYISVSKDELSISGVMYYTLETEEYTDTKRMVVLK